MTIRFEQAVYGSFPFWNRGYGVLAHSTGCRPEWLAELRDVCQRYGEPPTGRTSRVASSHCRSRADRGWSQAFILRAATTAAGRVRLRFTPYSSADGPIAGPGAIPLCSNKRFAATGRRRTRISRCLAAS